MAAHEHLLRDPPAAASGRRPSPPPYLPHRWKWSLLPDRPSLSPLPMQSWRRQATPFFSSSFAMAISGRSWAQPVRPWHSTRQGQCSCSGKCAMPRRVFPSDGQRKRRLHSNHLITDKRLNKVIIGLFSPPCHPSFLGIVPSPLQGKGVVWYDGGRKEWGRE